MAYSEEQRRAARVELARRELSRRQQSDGQQPEEDEDIPYTPPPKRTGWGAVGHDVGELPGKAIDYLAEKAQNLPGEFSEAGQQLLHHPFKYPPRVARNVLSELGEGAKQLYNLPLNINTYLGSKDIPLFKQTAKIAEKLKAGNTGAEQLLMGQPQPGDKLWKDLVELGSIYGGVKQIGKLVPKSLNIPERIKSQFQHGPLKRKEAALEQNQENINTTHATNENEYNSLKNLLEGEPGFETSNPTALSRKAREAKLKLEGLKQQSEATPENLRATEEPTAPETTPLSIVEPIRAEPPKPISEEGLNKAESLLKTNEQKAAEKEAEISQHLGEGNAHRKRVAEKLNPILEARQSEIGQGYDNYIQGLKGKQVALSNPRDAKAITADIQKRLQQGDTSSKEMIKLTDELANLGQAETIPADKFVSAYRTLRQMAQKTRSSAYGKSPQEFDRLKEAADSMDADVSKMAKIIDSGLGEENLDELHKLNHRWATEVTPLYKNKFFQHMQANNKAPTNMIEQLTNEPYIKSTNPNKITGTQILNEIIKGDPELLQNVVGERFAHKPEALHEWDESAHNFIQHMPELQKLRQEHFESRQTVNESKNVLEQARHEHQLQKEKAAVEQKQKNEVAAEQTRQKKAEVHKENQTKKAEYEAKKKYHKMQQDIKALEERHAKLSENAKKMKEKASQKNISLKEKMEIENQLTKVRKEIAAIEKDRSKLMRTGKFIGTTAVAVAVGAPLYKKAKSMIGRQ